METLVNILFISSLTGRRSIRTVLVDEELIPSLEARNYTFKGHDDFNNFLKQFNN